MIVVIFVYFGKKKKRHILYITFYFYDSTLHLFQSYKAFHPVHTKSYYFPNVCYLPYPNSHPWPFTSNPPYFLTDWFHRLFYHFYNFVYIVHVFFAIDSIKHLS
ncbi:unnamed protein product, partial [Vitis vinifera]